MLKQKNGFSIPLCLILFVAGAVQSSTAQNSDNAPFGGLHWRQIGPFRAGRVSTVAGVPGNPSIFYMGTPGGGVWKTIDGGMIWKPISDAVPVASIGAMAVAPSDPRIIYVGTGDVSNVGGSANVGDGVYKSTDSGQTWHHIGLEHTEKIGTLWVDSKNPDIVVVAALGQTFAPNAERGIYKTTDGGRTWRKVLYKDDVTGAIDVAFAPDNPRIGIAALWGHYVQPGNARALIDATGGGAIYKTEDGGETWTPINGSGWPTDKLGRIGVAVAPGGRRIFAIVAGQRQGGLYRSDDGGASWRKTTPDPRIQGSGYFSRVFLDPQNPNIIYVGQTSLYRSTDGGGTFDSFKGAPGGDDNHVLWIDPTNSNWMVMGSDQGGVVSMDGGQSWSSWYNQPTGQIYHLSTDNRFPYWVYGTQQDSGAIGTLTRGDYGAITFLDWDPVGGYEFGYIISDPLNPALIYSGGPGRGVVRIDRSNRQIATISPNISRDGDYRTAVNPPLEFSPQNPHCLYEGTQYLLETLDGGQNWKTISPDLTKRPVDTAGVNPTAPKPGVKTEVKPETKDGQPAAEPPNRSAINTFSLSRLKEGQIWVGTTNGLVQLTLDNGATWQNVSPPGLSRWTLISIVEASRFDAGTAYLAVDSHERNDFRPHFYRTHDFGKTWKETDTGIPDGSFARVVREDPERKGLLYAGTENGAYFSLDEGDHWNSLQLNMPTVSVRDLEVHGSDLVAGTYGRAFWILDDVSPFRQLNDTVAASNGYLFQPDSAVRMRSNMNGDTPFPPDMSSAENPPTGAVVDYYLKAGVSAEITLGIYDRKGELIRRFSSKPEMKSSEPPPNVPDYWLARPKPLTTRPGVNRFVWDLRYPSPPALRHNLPIYAIYQDTPFEPQGPLVLPGDYEVRLTVNDRTYSKPLHVDMDPRIKVSPTDLTEQLVLERKLVNELAISFDLYHKAANLRTAVAVDEKILSGGDRANEEDTKTLLAALQAFDQKLSMLQGEQGRGGGPAQGKPKPTFFLLNGELADSLTIVGGADTTPTVSMKGAELDYCRDLSATQDLWSALIAKDLSEIDAQLSRHDLPHLVTPSTSPSVVCKG